MRQTRQPYVLMSLSFLVGLLDRWVDGQMNGLTDQLMDGQTDRQITNGQTVGHTDKQTNMSLTICEIIFNGHWYSYLLQPADCTINI
jgi:hypothetical protein